MPTFPTIACVTDEIEVNLEYALPWLLSHGVRLVEVRTLSKGRVPEITDLERLMLTTMVRHGDIEVAALSPGIFKGPLADTARIAREVDSLLPRTIELAHELGTPTVIAFGFQRGRGEDEKTDGSPGEEARAAEILHHAAEMVRSAGMVLAVENEHGCVCDSGSATARVLAAADATALHAIWDPCNAYGSTAEGRIEDAFPTGYDALRPHIAGVHVKDTIRGAHIACVPVGQGMVDWRGLLRAVVRDGTVPHVTIETHCAPLEEMTIRNLQMLRLMFAEIAEMQNGAQDQAVLSEAGTRFIDPRSILP